MAEKFHERFHIEVPIEEAKRRFVNRAHNVLLQASSNSWSDIREWDKVMKAIATYLGEPYTPGEGYRIGDAGRYTRREFERTLDALEGLTRAFPAKPVGQIISSILDMAEVDLGVCWDGKQFLPSGAKLLDEKLVNDSLQWLRGKGYQTVLEPFEKALGHLLRARSSPELLSDVVTDAYEALEALAEIVTGKDTKLDAIQQEFISRINASDDYKRILKEYIAFAHKFRHGAAAPDKKPELSYAETESFVYLTGVFIRLAIYSGFAAPTAN
jgi:hypothetical protein